MEDTQIVKGHYCYMFRVDLSCNQHSKLQIEKWLELYSFSHWLGCHEIGTETGKHHYQMVVWREHKFLQKGQTKARNWWRGKTNSKTHGSALTSARKVASLASYSQKDEKKGENSQLFSTLCNLSSDQKSKISKWKSKTAVKLKNLEKLESTLKTVIQPLSKYEYCEKFNEIYYEIYGRPCMHRNTYMKYLYKAGYVTNNHIVRYVFNLDNQFGPGMPGHAYIDEDKIIDQHNLEGQKIAEYYGYDESSSVTQQQLEQYYKHHPKSSDIM